MRKRKASSRTKDEICRDLAFVLNSSLHLGTKLSVIYSILWCWTEIKGKYVGCKFWSKKAIAQYKNRETDKDLRHEHIVPRSIITKDLLEMEASTANTIFELLEINCIGVVVTLEEDRSLNKLGLRSKMPEDWDRIDPWARHRKAQIEIIDMDDANAQ
jgi:hypothetical protein